MQQIAELGLLAGAEPLEPLRGLPDVVEHALSERLSVRREDHVLHPAVVEARLPGHQVAGLQPVHQTGHVGAVTAQAPRQLAHGQGGAELKQRSGLRRVQVKFCGGDEKATPVLSKEHEQQGPDLIHGPRLNPHAITAARAMTGTHATTAARAMTGTRATTARHALTTALAMTGTLVTTAPHALTTAHAMTAAHAMTGTLDMAAAPAATTGLTPTAARPTVFPPNESGLPRLGRRRHAQHSIDIAKD